MTEENVVAYLERKCPRGHADNNFAHDYRFFEVGYDNPTSEKLVAACGLCGRGGQVRWDKNESKS